MGGGEDRFRFSFSLKVISSAEEQEFLLFGTAVNHQVSGWLSTVLHLDAYRHWISSDPRQPCKPTQELLEKLVCLADEKQERKESLR